MTVLTDWIGKRVMIHADRFFYIGLLVEERGPFAILDNAHQVVDYQADVPGRPTNRPPGIIDSIPLKKGVRVNMGKVESIYLEADAPWPVKPA